MYFLSFQHFLEFQFNTDNFYTEEMPSCSHRHVGPVANGLRSRNWIVKGRSRIGMAYSKLAEE
jgi:hypothetical protein